MKTHFYDIESLRNVFSLANFKPDENDIDIYLLCDTPSLTDVPDFEQQLLKRVHEKNHNFNGTISLHDLHQESANKHIAKTFGLSDAYMMNDPSSKSSYPDEFRLICDTDADYDDDIHPYLLGYNSYNYDTTELAMYLYEVFPLSECVDANGMSSLKATFKPTTAHMMRSYNDELFLPKFKESMPTRLTCTWDYANKHWSDTNYNDTRWRIRKNMLLSGRHIDVARLNEKQSKVRLKRLVGMLGGQILESDKLQQDKDVINTTDELLELLAYNVSDVVNLKLKLFDHEFYQAQFALKKGLLRSYPDIVYQKLPNEYKPNIQPNQVRRDRLTIDSSSAQFATKAICPYGHLKDMPVVSFMYPSEQKAKELGVPRLNILDESRKFFYKNFSQPELRAKFDIIYNYYKSIEGQNFNESNNYKEDYENTPHYRPPIKMSNIPKVDTCMFYYNADGTPSSCFVTFSIGGIHGAEYNKVLFEHDTAVFEEELTLLNKVKSIYPNPIQLKQAKKIIIDGQEYTAGKFLKSGSTLKNASYKDLNAKRPVLFKIDETDGSTELNTKYVYTSAALSNHEDFCSYYPNLLMMMLAFWNEGLGFDRYAEFFDDKQRYGKLMKDETYSKEERSYYSILREGSKLLLNSASGAADANFESNIRMNNTIISMRIIGQLFSWRIGQAQTLKGAKIISTNTDGLYSELEAEINNMILAKESADINIEIEPELTYLISKDTNNRLEMNPDTGKVDSASGGTLGCRQGPVPTKALAHPAIIDWALTEYLIMVSLRHKNLSLSTPFDNELGTKILQSTKNKFDSVKFLTMFQNVIVSSVGSINYIFGTTDENPHTPIILQHCNRVFIMKDKTPNAMHLYSANARKITPAQIKKRKENKERAQIHDDIAVQVLNANGINIHDLPKDKEAIIKKVTNIDNEWYMFIQNKDLNDLTKDELEFIIENIDYDKYLTLLRDCFEKNWRNKMPEGYVEPFFATGQTDITSDTTSEPMVTDEQIPSPVNGQIQTNKVTDTENEPQKDHINCHIDMIQTQLVNDLTNCLQLAESMTDYVGASDCRVGYVDDVCDSIQNAIDCTQHRFDTT